MNECMASHMNCVALAEPGRNRCKLHLRHPKLHPRELTERERAQRRHEDAWADPQPLIPTPWDDDEQLGASV